MSESTTVQVDSTNQTQSPTSPAKKSGSGCLKGCLIVLFIFILVLVGLAGAGWWFLNKQLGGIELSEPTTLTIESGQVERQSVTDWTQVTTGTTVSPGETLRTRDKTLAYITLSSGAEIRLDENTQITLTAEGTQTKINQDTGRTWSRIGRLLGKDESFEIESQTTLATVRGTAFTFIVSEDESMVDTDDGQVTVAAIEKIGKERKILSKIVVEKGFAAGILKKDFQDLKAGKKQLIKQAITEEIKNSDWFKGNRERDLKFLERLKQRKKLSPLELIKMVRNTSPQDLMKIQSLARRIASGEIELSEAQVSELERLAERVQSGNLDEPTLQAAADWLNSVDPANFSDTNHWKNSLRGIIPLLKKSGYRIPNSN